MDSGEEASGLLTLHLIALDHIEHETGPFSPEAIATLEGMDGVIGEVRATAEKLAPGTRLSRWFRIMDSPEPRTS